jgi:hypothetical protein
LRHLDHVGQTAQGVVGIGQAGEDVLNAAHDENPEGMD